MRMIYVLAKDGIPTFASEKKYGIRHYYETLSPEEKKTVKVYSTGQGLLVERSLEWLMDL